MIASPPKRTMHMTPLDRVLIELEDLNLPKRSKRTLWPVIFVMLTLGVIALANQVYRFVDHYQANTQQKEQQHGPRDSGAPGSPR